MPDQIYQEGQTATNKDGSKRVVFHNGMWINDTSFKPASAERVATSAQDRTELNAALSKAEAERDARRTYADAEQSVRTMGTGPVKAWYYDAITPNDERPPSSGFWGGLGDAIGAVPDAIGVGVGTLARALTSQETFDARDHLKTVNANVALAGSQKMKGSSSDKDTALMRLSGIGDYKTEHENLRLIKQANYNSGLEQTRALVKSDWIGKYGSLANPSPNGMTIAHALEMGDQRYDEYYKGKRTLPSKTKGLPKPPPGVASSKTVTIDLNGNVIND